MDKTNKSPNILINKVYTRQGDNGETRIADGEIRSKDDPRIESYGTVDELNAHLGLCRDMLINKKDSQFDNLIKYLKIIQNELFDLGTQLALADESIKSKLPKIKNNSIINMEKQIDLANSVLSELKSCVLPGGNLLNSQFHIARNICRRAERRSVALSKLEPVDEINIIYLNRLSDALFVWSRWISYILGTSENLWEPNIK
jgi:cob(I)alamin adenosyltransferase